MFFLILKLKIWIFLRGVIFRFKFYRCIDKSREVGPETCPQKRAIDRLSLTLCILHSLTRAVVSK